MHSLRNQKANLLFRGMALPEIVGLQEELSWTTRYHTADARGITDEISQKKSESGGTHSIGDFLCIDYHTLSVLYHRKNKG